MKGFIKDIEEMTLSNNNYRSVLYTGKHSQIVLMCIPPGLDIGEEIHEDTDQFFRIELGKCSVHIDEMVYEAKDGDAVLVPAGARHNLINTSECEQLKLYTIYSPPHHKDGIVHLRKEDAQHDDEHFDGKTTE